MIPHRPIVGTPLPPRAPRILAILLGAFFASMPSPAPAASQASLPRVLVRDPFGVPPARVDDVIVTVAGAVRDAGGAAIRCRDFARLADSRPDVKGILDDAREKVKTGIELDRQGKSTDAVAKFTAAIDDYDSVGMEVWSPAELSSAWAHLGVARAHLAVRAKKAIGPDVTEALQRAKALFPEIQLSPTEYKDADVLAFKKATTAPAPPPSAPGDGFWSLARVMGLDALVEVRSDDHGLLSLRAHRVKPANVRSSKIASKAPGLDSAARQQLIDALGFAPNTAVAVATPKPMPTFLGETGPVASPTPVAIVFSTPKPTPAPTVVAAATPKATPVATPIAVAAVTPKPTPVATPVAIAAATPKATPVAMARIDTEPTPAPPVARASGLPGGDSSVSLLGGTDHRGAVYSATDHFVNAASGDGGSLALRVWYALGRSWAIDAGGGGMQRSYLLAQNVKKSGMGQEAWANVLHGDDANGVWWVGAGVGYISEPKFVLPGPSQAEIVPATSRISPSVVGEARIALFSRLGLRARAGAGAAIETTSAGFGSGVGFDLRAEGAAVVSVTRRVRLTAGGGMHRITTQYSKKQTGIEARRSVWAGVEAAF